MKTYRGMEVKLHYSWPWHYMEMSSHQLHASFALPRRKSPRYQLDRGMGGPQSDLDAMDKRKISCPCQESNASRPARSPSIYRIRYALPILFLIWSIEYYLICPIHFEPPHYAVFSSPLLGRPSKAQVFRSVLSPSTPSIHVEVKFHTHTKQQVQLQTSCITFW
jgi:hypothetical protein